MEIQEKLVRALKKVVCMIDSTKEEDELPELADPMWKTQNVRYGVNQFFVYISKLCVLQLAGRTWEKAEIFGLVRRSESAAGVVACRN